MSGGPQRIVIVGGGYVGVDAYRALLRGARRAVRSGRVQITVVNPTPFHSFHGFTGEVLVGQVALPHVRAPLAPLLPHAQVVQGTVTHVDLSMRRVQVQAESGAEHSLPFDQLVLGVGSVDPFERVPGLREHGWALKRPQDMQAFRTALQERFAARVPTTVNVIGGGYAGVEMAAAIRERQRRDGLPGEVHLICSGAVLDTLPPELDRLRVHARASLVDLGVQVHEGQRVQAIEGSGARLEDGELRPADLTLFAAGIAHAPLSGTEALPRDARGRLMTDPFLRVPGFPGVWAGGDAAAVRHPRGGECPVNALWAMKHGMCIGRNVARSLRGAELTPFRYGGLGQSASLGRWNGVTELRGLLFTGPVAWVMRLGFFAWFMPSKRHGAQVTADLLWRAPRARRTVRPLDAAPATD
ncbi:NAD(P)/FAD-dependent oxidoreductase [Deinococcus sedimenti]|uniref:NADH dehydrogenase n=1 Tax=Deinococcus sedimenti TaxID=1867090 RepID=A0ABQ2S1S8_9DEIO|nr:FAD-dependent oxidoreductase [Deinococcus sedimenti]GGR80202.1 NADH dehydrogenase [Deinococcus sedimenti]